MELKELAFYPGCTLEGTSSGYTESIDAVLRHLDIQLTELKDWNCCGATSAHSVNHDLHLALTHRNLTLAESAGYKELLAPCAACFHRLASANHEFKTDKDQLAQTNARTGLNYQGSLDVVNILDFLGNRISSDCLSQKVVQPLNGLKIACYYGCLNTKVPRVNAFDSIEYPMTMDRIVESMGATPIDWSYKTECCGAGLGVTNVDLLGRIMSKILEDAIVREADCMVVACPMCHVNLDTKQTKIMKEFQLTREIPIYYITQLMGLAFGIDANKLGIKQNFIPALHI